MADSDTVAVALADVQIPSGSTFLSCHIVGSHSHGTYIPPTDDNGVDDLDVLAVVVPPLSTEVGVHVWEGANQWVGRHDIVVYSLKKLMRLLAKSNPNVLCLLAMPGDCVTHAHPAWSVLLDNKDLFITRAAFGAFAGYANAQMKKMEHNAHAGYMGEKRKQIVAKFGYDTKNAAHLIRLLRMCRDLFTTGQIVVRRPDAAHLLSIKRGEKSLTDVRAEAMGLFASCREAMEASTLPRDIDTRAVSALSADLHRSVWGGSSV